MKRTATLLLITIFLLGMLFSSCNRKLCPAYAGKIKTEQVKNKA